MPSIGKHPFVHLNKAGEKMSFEAAMSVDSQGVFSIMVPDVLESACRHLQLDIARPKTNLFVRGRDLEKVKSQVRQAVVAHMETEAVTERVIVFSTDIKASFWQNPDGSMASNGYMGVSREQGGDWGTIGDLDARQTVPHYVVGLGARVVDRVEHRRGDSVIKVRYVKADTGRFDWNDGMEWAHRLNSFTGLHIDLERAHGMQRMPYTEEAAKFFHDSLIGLCVLARQIDGFFKSPEALQLAIEKQLPMLGAPVTSA